MNLIPFPLAFVVAAFPYCFCWWWCLLFSGFHRIFPCSLYFLSCVAPELFAGIIRWSDYYWIIDFLACLEPIHLPPSVINFCVCVGCLQACFSLYFLFVGRIKKVSQGERLWLSQIFPGYTSSPVHAHLNSQGYDRGFRSLPLWASPFLRFLASLFLVCSN